MKMIAIGALTLTILAQVLTAQPVMYTDELFDEDQPIKVYDNLKIIYHRHAEICWFDDGPKNQSFSKCSFHRRLHFRQFYNMLRATRPFAEPIGPCGNLAVIIHSHNDTLPFELFEAVERYYANYIKNHCTILFDWNQLNDPYVSMESVGRQLGVILYLMVESWILEPKNIHLIAYDWAPNIAHTASVWYKHLMFEYGDKIGAKFKEWKIGRITALDPREGPLVAEDAAFVDAIHTTNRKRARVEIKPLNVWYAVGDGKSIGAIDFYPNDGVAPQPTCDYIRSYKSDPDPQRKYSGEMTTENIRRYQRALACSHYTSVTFFIQSLKDWDGNPRGPMDFVFPSAPCDSFENLDKCIREHGGLMSSMGIQANYFNGRGKHFLRACIEDMCIEPHQSPF